MSERLRILCAIHGLSGGGAEHLMAGLASRLAARHDVTLVTLAPVELDVYPVAASVRRVGLELTGKSRWLGEAIWANMRRLRGLRRVVRDECPQVVIAFCDQLNTAISLSMVGLSVPLIVSEMTDPRFHPLPRMWRWIRPWAYRHATAAVAISAASLPIVSQLHGRPARLIPPAVDHPPETIKPDLPSNGRRRLASLGRLAREKRHDWLIRAFGELAAEFPDWDLEIAGDGPMRDELRQLILTMGLESRVRLRGRIPEIWGFLAGASAWALTSKYEGTPVALLEALRVGVPAIAVRSDSGLEELMVDERNGLLVEAEMKSLVVGLRRLLSDDALRLRLSVAGPATAAGYDWSAFVGRYEDLARECVVRGRRAAVSLR